jgi:hypothetical protein
LPCPPRRRARHARAHHHTLAIAALAALTALALTTATVPLSPLPLPPALLPLQVDPPDAICMPCEDDTPFKLKPIKFWSYARRGQRAAARARGERSAACIGWRCGAAAL